MNPTFALFQREWLQHRFAWILMTVLPLLVAVLLLSAADIRFDNDGEVPPPAALAAGAMALSAMLLVALAATSGLVTTVGLARRDHADRSVEFWLSMPISHSRSLLLPMLVHLVLLPLVALALALLAGLLLALLLVWRVHGLQDGLGLSGGEVLTGILVALARVWAGWPLAVLWLSPLILLAMLAYAWLRRWGLVVLGLGLAVGASPLGTVLGYPLVPRLLDGIFTGAARSFFSAQHSENMTGDAGEVVRSSVQQAPGWLVEDIVGSLQNLASPLFLGGLTFAALCFYGLVQWRRRGASATV